MSMHRQIFLAGASMSFVARQVHECLKARAPSEQDYLLKHCKEKSGMTFEKAALLDPQKAVEAIDRALEVAFKAWRTRAVEESQPLLQGGELPLNAQLLVLEHLPIAPMDYGNPEFIGALSHCAQYYLNYVS